MGQNNGNGKNGRNEALKKSTRELIADSGNTMRGVREAMRDMRNVHKRMGVPLVGMKDGKMVTIEPEDIQVEDVSETA
jgi:hypothetical protein